MIIAAIKTNNSEKLLAIAKRFTNGRLSSVTLCDWNTKPNTLRIFWANDYVLEQRLESFKEACKLIFSL